MSLDELTNEEIIARMKKILEDVDELLREVGPKLIRIGHLKEESAKLAQLLRSRETSETPNSSGVVPPSNS